MWKLEFDDKGKLTKVPYHPNGYKASSTNDETWSTFEACKAAYEDEALGFAGVGFFFNEDYTGTDYDHCINPAIRAGEIVDSLTITCLKKLNSYVEISQSGTGVHCIIKGAYTKGQGKGRKSENYEIYCRGRFFVMTGNVLENADPSLKVIRADETTQVAIDEVYDLLFPADDSNVELPAPFESMAQVAAMQAMRLTDDKIIELASKAKNCHKFNPLFAGDTSGYKSESEADQALACMLAFYTDDEAQILRIISLSGLWDEKWERQDYQKSTIGNALRMVAEKYKGNGSGTAASKGEKTTLPEISEDDLLKIKIPENPRFKTNLESDNFIQEFMRYGETVTDSYQDYWFAGGLTCLSVAVNRNAVIELRQGSIFPNVWINILGLSSLARKSTAIDKADLAIAAANIDPSCKMPDEFSPEAMIEMLDRQPRAYMIKDESAGLLAIMKKDYMRGLKDALMQLYDGKDINRELRTSRRKSDKTSFQVKNPYLNLMLATTPGSFAANTELLDVTSGWLPRFLHFFPNHVKDRWLPLEEGVPENDLLSAACHARLIKVRSGFYDLQEPRTMHLSPDASAYFIEWQKIREGELVEAKDDRRAQFYSRLAVYALKMSILFTIGRADYKNGMEISLDHMQEACRLIDVYFMPMAMTVADLVGKAADKNNLDKVVAVLTSQGGKMKRRELGRKTHLRVKDLDETLESLGDFGEIEIVTVSNRQGSPTIWVMLSQDNGNESYCHSVTSVKAVILSHRNDSDEVSKKEGIRAKCDTCDGSVNSDTCVTCDTKPVDTESIKSDLQRGEELARQKEGHFKTPSKSNETIVCAVCGTDLIVNGKIVKGHTCDNGKFYCASPGCGYPKRGEAAKT